MKMRRPLCLVSAASLAIVLSSCGRKEVAAPTPTTAVAVAVSKTHACAALSDGTAWCWGGNARRQLGDGTAIDQLTPVRVRGVDDVVDLAVGDGTTCVLRRAGAVMCTDARATGAAGSLRVVPGLGDATKIAGFVDCSCAIRRTGQLVCWGAGEAPTSVMVDFTEIVDFAGVDAVRDRAGRVAHPGPLASESYESDVRERQTHIAMDSECIRKESGVVECHGALRSPEGGLEGGLVPGVTDARALGLMFDHGCSLGPNGQVSCWGGLPYEAPRALARAGDIASLAEQSGGQDTLCGIRRSGTVACWSDAGPIFTHLGVASSASAPEMTVTDVVLPPAR